MRVISQERGLRRLKEGISLERYRAKYPTAMKANVPSIKTLQRWDGEGWCKCPDGCRVEPDGECSHGWKSWLLIIGII